MNYLKKGNEKNTKAISRCQFAIRHVTAVNSDAVSTAHARPEKPLIDADCSWGIVQYQPGVAWP